MLGQLLRFCQDEEAPWWHGVLFALGLPVTEMIRLLLFAASWGTSYRYGKRNCLIFCITGHYRFFGFRTGNRLRSGIMTMLFKKVMRLSSLGDKSIGEAIIYTI